MSEMVERVARALFKIEWANKGHSWEMEAAHHDYWREAARAAIAAMREPLWDALRAQCCATNPPTDAKTIVQLRRADLDAAIDAALGK